MTEQLDEQSRSYQAVHERAPVNLFPWVCELLDCDEALPPNRPEQRCPRCGSRMIRGGRFLSFAAREDRS